MKHAALFCRAGTVDEGNLPAAIDRPRTAGFQPALPTNTLCAKQAGRPRYSPIVPQASRLPRQLGCHIHTILN